MLNDYLSDLRLLKMLGLIMLGLTLLWITISGISSLIQHWRRPKRPDAPAPLPADDREDFIRDRKREEPNKREMPLPAPFRPLRSDDDIVTGDFDRMFLQPRSIRARSTLYVSSETKRKVLEVVRKVGDRTMPAVQTENSDEWPSMEQPQTTEPVSGKKIVIPDFEQTYMTRHDIHVRSALYVSIDTKRKVLEVVKKIGSEYMTATSYVENIVQQHLELYKNDINRIYKQKGTKNLI